MKHFGIEEDEILPLVEDNIRQELEISTALYYQSVLDYTFIYNPSNYTGVVLKSLWDNFASMDQEIYIDQLGRPNFILNKYPLLNNVPCPATIRLKSDAFDKDPISNEYKRMARALGIDPNDERYKAFIIYLGASYDEANIKETLRKLYPWTNIFMDYNDPSMLVSMKQKEGADAPYLNGYECYLVVPKYKNASVALKELEISEGGSLKEVENYYLDYNACAGVTFLCLNVSEIAPNGKIIIRYRDDLLEFSPVISLKDGHLILPEEVVDADDILDWRKLMMNEVYSHTMYERLVYILNKGNIN